MMKNSIVAFFFLLGTGCTLITLSGIRGTSSVPSSYTLQEAAEENKGLLIVATRFTLYCRAVDPLGIGVGSGDPDALFSGVWPYGVLYVTNGNDTIDLSAYAPAVNIRASDYRSPPGFFHVVKMTPGDYYFNSITGHQDQYSYITDRFASLPFTIEKGKATYVGEVSISVTECNYAELSVEGEDDEQENKNQKEANVKYRVSNQWHRDSRMLKGRYRNIDPAQVKLMITHI